MFRASSWRAQHTRPSLRLPVPSVLYTIYQAPTSMSVNYIQSGESRRRIEQFAFCFFAETRSQERMGRKTKRERWQKNKCVLEKWKCDCENVTSTHVIVRLEWCVKFETKKRCIDTVRRTGRTHTRTHAFDHTSVAWHKTDFIIHSILFHSILSFSSDETNDGIQRH